ncbi:MAG: type IV pilin protein [Myxococcota bacterium]
MLRNLKKREGFTLIELMIVVAIIGILAAIAIPNFIKFQLRSKAGEGKVNLAAIRTAEESYFAEAGTYLEWNATPAAIPGQQKVLFAAACPAPLPAAFSALIGYCWIGWQPEGDVFYSYENTVNFPGGQSNQFWAEGVSDIDGDFVSGAGGLANPWGIDQPDTRGTSLAAPTATLYPCAAVLDAGTGLAALGQVGPCDSVDNARNTF